MINDLIQLIRLFWQMNVMVTKAIRIVCVAISNMSWFETLKCVFDSKVHGASFDSCLPAIWYLHLKRCDPFAKVSWNEIIGLCQPERNLDKIGPVTKSLGSKSGAVASIGKHKPFPMAVNAAKSTRFTRFCATFSSLFILLTLIMTPR